MTNLAKLRERVGEDRLCWDAWGDATQEELAALLREHGPIFFERAYAYIDALEREVHESHEGCDPDCPGYSDCQHPNYAYCWFYERLPWDHPDKFRSDVPPKKILTENACPICRARIGGQS